MTETVIPQSTGASAAEAAAAGQQAFVVPEGPPPAYDDRELPPGWVRQFDPKVCLGPFVSAMLSSAADQ